jgi:hypothetical protein
MTHDKAHVRRELLTYLASVPKTLNENGPDCAGQIAVSLGNALLWLQGTLDEPGPLIEVPLHETPQTIYALGKQLRAVGLSYWEADRRKPHKIVEQLEADLVAVTKRLTYLEAAYVERGGGL